MEEWYCLATVNRREQLAVEALKAKKVETFAPPYDEPRGSRLVRTRLFPGYVLAYASLLPLRELLAQWRLSHFLSAVGIHNLVGICGQPTFIEGDFVEELKTHVDKDGVFRLKPKQVVLPSYAAIKPGTKIRIVGGPNVGCAGEFVRMKGMERSIVLITMFGRQCAAEVNRVDVDLESDFF